MTKIRALALAAPAALALSAGCLDSTGPAEARTYDCAPALLEIGPVAGDTVTTESGLRYIDIEAGTGAAATVGTPVAVHYTGTLLDGTLFDSSCSRRIPATLLVGRGSYIAGFEQGVVGLREGGVRRLIIPPSLGYGDQPRDPIPANSTLVFDIHLADIL